MIHSDPTNCPRRPLEVWFLRMQWRLAQASRRGLAWRGASAHMMQCVSVPLERGTDCHRNRQGRRFARRRSGCRAKWDCDLESVGQVESNRARIDPSNSRSGGLY